MSDGESGGREERTDEGTDSGGSDDRRGNDQEQETSTAEKAVMVVSAAFTVLLLAYVGWQIATPPQADDPQVSIVETEPLTNDSVAVTVRLRNPTGVGYVSVTAESNCTSPPPRVQFSYVPASTVRTATLVCPAGTTSPSVSLVSWTSR